ncbi:hypothetical protein K0M31_005682, partial [Melipona bicolor]
LSLSLAQLCSWVSFQNEYVLRDFRELARGILRLNVLKVLSYSWFACQANSGVPRYFMQFERLAFIVSCIREEVGILLASHRKDS